MIDTAVLAEGWPSEHDWGAIAERAVAAAIAATPHAPFATQAATYEVSVKYTDDEEVQALNRDYRGKDKPTNVLSFPMIAGDELSELVGGEDAEIMLGDIVLARGICEGEAGERGVSIAAHATHLIVHGTLHLLGYDHVDVAEGDAMEALERLIMASLGLHDPYQTIQD